MDIDSSTSFRTMNSFLLIATSFPKAVEGIILICRDNLEAGRPIRLAKYPAKITGGNDESNFVIGFIGRRSKKDKGVGVVCCLRKDVSS
jgi:hypothetical protein